MSGTKTANSVAIKFSSIPSNVNIGDVLYHQISNGTNYQIGKITTITTDSNDLKVVNVAVATNIGHLSASFGTNGFWYAAKDSVAESFGLKGYFAKIKLTNNSTEKVEVFSVNSEVSKSFP